MQFSKNAFDLIVHFETDDLKDIDQPSKWPQGASGITLGVGSDLGYTTKQDFTEDWKEYLPPTLFNKLLNVIGVKGIPASKLASSFIGDKITPEVAIKQFQEKTLPKELAKTRAAFMPGFDSLPVDVQGALVSLAFNRGLKMTDSNVDNHDRLEMRNIRNLVITYPSVQDKKMVLTKIAQEFRNMKRLWQGKHLDGLIARREAEAKLVEGSIQEV